MKLMYPILLLVACSAELTKLTMSAPVASQWLPHHGPPPLRRFLPMNMTPQFLQKSNVRGELSAGVQSSTFDIFWKSTTGGAYREQTMATSYYVTALLTSGDSQFIYVGGKRRSNGHTVIQRLAIGGPLTVTNVNNPAQSTIFPAQVTEIVTLYDDAVEGRDYVRAILENRSSHDQLFVRFDDSGDVYEFDTALEAHPFNLVASNSASYPGALKTPALSQITTGAWSAQHHSLGHVYAFTVEGLTDNYDVLVLSDNDMDGGLDVAYSLDTAGWSGLGLGDQSNYADLAK